MIRLYRPEDLEALRRIHAESGMGYEFPDLRDWRFNPVLVVEEEGEVVAGAGLRLTSEAFLWMKKSPPLETKGGAPKRVETAERWKRLLELHEAVRCEAERLGYEDAHAFLPPPIAEQFGRRLKRLGWIPEPFACYWRQTARTN